jgi:ATP-dependent DNA helicase RecG
VSDDNPWQIPLEDLPGISPTRLELLGRLGLRTVGDLLLHLPRAYDDLNDVRAISALTVGSVQTVEGEVVELQGDSLADGRTVVRVVISDDGRSVLEGVWFNQPFAARPFRYGQRVAFSGKPRRYRDHWQMTSPRYQILQTRAGAATAPPATRGGVVPVYPLTEDLRPEQLRAMIRRALQRYGDRLQDIVPPSLLQRRDLPALVQALNEAHFPASVDAAGRARRRFVYEEFLVLQVALALRRREVRDGRLAPPLPVTPLIDARIRRLFPFRLTADQDRAVGEICRDLADERPMQRLLQADVGAGKTAVAAYALLVAVANKHQAALMAPTEVLARQHSLTLDHYLAHSRVRRLLLTGALSPRERQAALDGLAAGEIDLVVGTQALVQEDVCFARLGLVVIDEQHRFGVHQRARFRRLGTDPHYLVMTATPIPRTVALSMFGDLDVSVLRQLPPGRHPVSTRWVGESGRPRVWDRLRHGLGEGRQAYVVCPLVQESEALDVKAATQTFAELQAAPFSEFRVGLLHGRQDDQTKAGVMARFRDGQLDLLVCTSVVEVGVDVPNATLIVVEHAERFGLSQLHQLRGRVSRGRVPGECYLFAAPPTDEARSRLRAFVRTTDGFALAEEDVRLRGVGEFFGARQHGLGELRIANLVRDAEVLSQARQDAFAVVANDLGLRLPDHAPLRAAVIARYGRTLDLAEIG